MILRTAAAVVTISLAAFSGDAQTLPPRDTIIIAGDTAGPTDTLRLGADPAPAQPSRWSAPFAVESRGQAVARRTRPEVVWTSGRSPTAPEPEAEVAVVAPDTSEAAPARRAERTPTDSTASPPRDTAARTGTRARTHTVASGETLFGIARRYSVTTAQLRVLNPGVDADSLEVGAVLRLPATARAPNQAASTPARTPARPASAPARTPARTPARNAPARRTHTVARGETLFGVARRFGVSVDAIMRANRLESDQVRVGQVLVIP